MTQRISLLTIFSFWIGSSLFASHAVADKPTTSQGVRAFGGSFSAVDGSVVSLSDFEGSVVLLHFFASWCGECIVEAPTLQALATSTNIPDLKIVGVAIDDTIEGARAFVEAHKWSFPVIVDTEGALRRRYVVRGVPSTVLLDTNGSQMSFIDPASGRKVYQVTGARDWGGTSAKESLRKSIEQPAASNSRV